MKRKNFLKVVVLLLFLGGCGYFLGRWLTGSPSRSPAMENRETVQSATAQPSDQDSEQRPNSQDPWLVSQNKIIEAIIEKLREEGFEVPPEKQEEIRADIATQYQKIREAGGEVPEPSDMTMTATTTTTLTGNRGKRHEGAQTPEAIMETFDAMYNKHDEHRIGDEADIKYPRKEWIQRCLDRGIVFEYLGDYSTMLSIRYPVVNYEKILSSDGKTNAYALPPDYYGLPPDASLEAYTNATIDRTIQDLEEMEQAELEGPTVVGGFGTRNRLIPMREGVLYVKMDQENFAANFYGKSLSEEEKDALLFDGVPPEGLEVVYLDEDDKPLPPGVKPKFDWANYKVSDEEWARIAQRISDEELMELADVWKAFFGTEGREPESNPLAPDVSPMTNNRSSQPLTSNQDSTQPTLSSTTEQKPLKVNPDQIGAFFEKLETEHGELQLPKELQMLKRLHKAYQRQQKAAGQPSRTKAMESESQPKVASPAPKSGKE